MADNDLGRNTLCPCGSGKKYKKCCLPRVKELEWMDWFAADLAQGAKNLAEMENEKKVNISVPVDNPPTV